MRMIALIQAQMASSQSPSNVFKSLAGKPMLWHVVQRVRQVKLLHDVVVVTSFGEKDSRIVRLCEQQDFKVFTGSEKDALDCFYHAAQSFQAQAVLRIKADCPFIDPKIISQLIHQFNICQWDYAGINTAASVAHSKSPRFPDGLDAEIIRFSSLQQVWRDAQNPMQREQITPYLFRHPKQFKLGILSPNQDYSHIRLTANTPSDYAFAKLIYKHLYRSGQIFNFNDVVNFLNKHVELISINQKPEVGGRYEKA